MLLRFYLVLLNEDEYDSDIEFEINDDITDTEDFVPVRITRFRPYPTKKGAH